MSETTDRLTLEQIFSVIPREEREGKRQCPRCHRWHLSLNKQTADFNCFSSECEGRAKEIAALIRKEVEGREAKPKKSDAPSDSLTLNEYSATKMLPREFLVQHFGV